MIAYLRVSLGSKKVCIAKNLAGLFTPLDDYSWIAAERRT